MGDLIGLKKIGSIALLEINNPPVNIIDSAVIMGLINTLNDLGNDPFCRAVIISGAGEKGFSAGASVAEHLPEEAPEMIEKMVNLLKTMHSTQLITIATVHGFCFGGGAEVALACDFVIASEDAKFGIPEITLGCYPPFAMLQLPNLVGIRKAKEMILSGRAIKAEDAKKIGLINLIVGQDALEESAIEFLTPILNNPPRIVALTLTRLREIESLGTLDGHQKMGQLFIDDLCTHPDYIEGITSFLEKRKPSWKAKRFCAGGCGCK
ncbi:MAG TPA: hypothetical protein HA340_01330 [Candidatus Thalassarchaeaceae archaeon]|jgi:cyclohexa-1,5-dienecarbonyl-CoA hydratase|nr:hypothetical protein [Euryarchaeota archaeon]MDP6742556.1 enoyl-CoA hydratase-related protein [Candidatus Thalassarchaeaceae archaeon]MDP7043766.1 enoyl-CoA hydratase-related protein [Candidatus Thalassarchaeaceae archaeon]DAC51774.1 MAG TPA: hypothetical protein D7H97_01295 [Candidatus Poseidoniales archaeon]HIH82568.1 hypothetical protein [Candidatus Thalassarchaeaceae archaeon]|tara:strand:+ start:8055 stop:8852 length:798 start_codon:yes stop_codon:yes gene_type:complete